MRQWRWRQRRERAADLARAWYTAAFTRARELPDLEAMVAEVMEDAPATTATSSADPRRLKALFLALCQATGGKDLRRKADRKVVA